MTCENIKTSVDPEWNGILSKVANSLRWRPSTDVSLPSSQYALNEYLTTIQIETINPNPANDFGSSLDVSNGFVIIGAPSIQTSYLYKVSFRNTYTQVAEFSSDDTNFGIQVRLSESLMVIQSDSALHIFTGSGSSWENIGTLSTTNLQDYDVFQNQIHVGYSNQVFVYEVNNRSIDQIQTIIPLDSRSTDNFGYRLRVDDHFLAVIEQERRNCYVYYQPENNSGIWIEQDRFSSGTFSDSFGEKIDIDGECKRVVISDSNSVHVFDYTQKAFRQNYDGISCPGEDSTVTTFRNVTPNSLSIAFQNVITCPSCDFDFDLNDTYCLEQLSSDVWAYHNGQDDEIKLSLTSTGTNTGTYLLEAKAESLRAFRGQGTFDVSSGLFVFSSVASTLNKANCTYYGSQTNSAYDGSATVTLCCPEFEDDLASDDLIYQFSLTETITGSDNFGKNLSVHGTNLMVANDDTVYHYILNPNLIASTVWNTYKNTATSTSYTPIIGQSLKATDDLFLIGIPYTEDNEGKVHAYTWEMTYALPKNGCDALIHIVASDCDTTVESIDIDVAGNGYSDSSETPKAIIVGGCGKQARANPIINKGQITDFNIVSKGSGYDEVLPDLYQLLSTANTYNQLQEEFRDKTNDDIDDRINVDQSFDDTEYTITIVSNQIDLVNYRAGDIIKGGVTGTESTVVSFSKNRTLATVIVNNLNGRYRKTEHTTDSFHTIVTGGSASSSFGQKPDPKLFYRGEQGIDENGNVVYVIPNQTFPQDNFSPFFGSITNSRTLMDDLEQVIEDSLDDKINTTEVGYDNLMNDLDRINNLLEEYPYQDHQFYRNAVDRINELESVNVVSSGNSDYIDYYLNQYIT